MEPKKPSHRIAEIQVQLVKEWKKNNIHGPDALFDATQFLPNAIVQYLDEQQTPSPSEE